MASAELTQLLQSISDLKVGLMSYAERVDGDYSKEELLKCRAFIAFSHAEIETYLERISKSVLDNAFKHWQNHGIYGRVIVALLAYRTSETFPPADPLKPGNADIKKVIEKAYDKQIKIINDNNGIKRFNIAEMFFPIGIFTDDLDSVLLLQLDQTGSQRGDMVHKSSHISLPKIRDPFSDEQKDIEALISEIEKFDNKLETLGLLPVALH